MEQEFKKPLEQTKYYFFREDLNFLEKQINEIQGRIKEAGQEMGTSTKQSSETFHDNFGHEQGVRDFRMWSHRLSELVKIKNNAKIIENTENKGKVRMGRTITICNIESKEQKTFRIGSFMVLNSTKDSGIPVLSYDAPMPKALMGSSEGDERELYIDGKKHILEIIKIE